MFKKVKRTRAFVCLLLMFAVLLAWGFAENAAQAPAVDGAAEATVEEALDAPAEDTLERDLAAANGETDFAGGTVRVIETQEEEETAQIDFVSGMQAIWESTGLANGDWQQYAMILIAFVLLYLAIVRGFEPLLLLPISFGMLLANLPLGGLMDDPTFKYFATLQEAQQYAAPYGKEVTMVSKMFWDVGGQVFTSESAALAAGFDAALPTCSRYFRDLYQVADANGGLFYYLYQGVKLGIYPPLIFMGVGAMTDFAPLIANPKSLLLGAAAQLGIFIAFILARLLGFAPGYPEGTDRKYFDLRSGIFVAEKPLHNYYLTPAHAAPFFALGDPEKSPDFAHEKDYLNLWHILMTYFSLHIEGFQRPRSLEFLQQLTRIEYFPPKE